MPSSSSRSVRSTPMRIASAVTIDIPHPRSISDPRAVAFKDSILHQLHAIPD